MRNWIRIIHVAKTKCGLDDEAYRAMLDGAAGVSSSKEIVTRAQFDSVMACFHKLGFKSKDLAQECRWRCSIAQQRKILALWQLVARNPTEEALRAFVQRISSVEVLAWVDKSIASKIIVALSAMARQDGFDPDTGNQIPQEAQG